MESLPLRVRMGPDSPSKDDRFCKNYTVRLEPAGNHTYWATWTYPSNNTIEGPVRIAEEVVQRYLNERIWEPFVYPSVIAIPTGA